MHAIARDWRTADLSDADAAICAYAEKLTHHQQDMGPEDIDVLRGHGFDDTAVLDATQVIAYFNSVLSG